MTAIWNMDAHEIADLVRRGELTASEVLEQSLVRIGRYDGKINSFSMIDPEGAVDQARAVDRLVSKGEDPGPLAGVPFGVKDLENAEGLPTSFGSLLFKDNVATIDSTQVSRLRDAGAVVLGKTTVPEMGAAFYTSSKLTGITRNPWNLERTPGGSSGGSAAAVAAGLVPLATGSDGGGSLRIPAAYTGLPALKVTYGLIPRGPGRFGSANLGTYGPMARSITDIARYLDQVVGPDPMDPFSVPTQIDSYEDLINQPFGKLKAVWTSTLGFGTCDSSVESVARSAAEKLFVNNSIEEVAIDVTLPDVGPSWAVAEVIDCYADLEAFWPARSDEMTPVISLAMQMAEELSPDQIAEAVRGRFELLRIVNDIFEQVDLIVTPTTSTSAFAADGPMPHSVDGEFLRNPLVAICFTYPFNLTGHPAISLPAGLDPSGLPVGFQLIGPRFSEPTLLKIARSFEQQIGWPKLSPDYA